MDGGGTAGAHVLRARHTRAVRGRNGRPLSSVLNSIWRLNSLTWSNVRWPSDRVRRRATAYPWAEATRVAVMWCGGAWDVVTLCCILGLKRGAQSLGVGSCELGAVCCAYVCLTLGFGLAGSTQVSVTDWAGVAMRDRAS